MFGSMSKSENVTLPSAVNNCTFQYILMTSISKK